MQADGGKTAKKLDEALGGVADRRRQPKGVTKQQTFGEAAGAEAAAAQAALTSSHLAAFED